MDGQTVAAFHGRTLNKEKLIEEVRCRPLLWKEGKPDIGKKFEIDKLWEDIAAACNTHPLTARKKWKNLRDHFRKEYKKFVFNPESQNRTKWHYFDSMLFLREYMRPWNGLERMPSPDAASENVDVEQLDSPSTSTTEYSRNIQSRAPSTCAEGDLFNEPPKKKKKLVNDMKSTLLELEKRKVELLEREFDRETNENPELQFFKSILPHMESFSQTEKLEVRASILQVIIDKQNEKLKQRQQSNDQ